MPKIQILNENQVQHFYSLIEPKLAKEFNAFMKTKEEEVKANKVNFLEHKDVLEIKTKRKEELTKIEKIAEVIKTLKELSSTIKLTEARWSGDYLVSAQSYVEDKVKFLEDFNKETERRIDDKTYTLSYEASKMSELYAKRWEIQNLLRARLCMVAVADADTIENKMLQEIKVDSFFTV